MEKLKHFIKAQQCTPEFLQDIFFRADYFQGEVDNTFFSSSLKGKIMASLFYEPSTRTRFSFESAMLRLGGKVIGTENASEFSSAAKGESLEDTTRIIDDYVHVIVLRHKEEGSAERAAAVSKVPVINAGDGKGQHPTQALLDVYTIYSELGKIDNTKVALIGDLANGRTVRSLAYLLSKYNNVEITFVSPEILKIGEDIKEHLKEHNMKFKEETSLGKVLPEADVVYMTRIQRERDEKLKDVKTYTIDEKMLNLMKKDAILMHPLPHVEEISLPVDVEEKDKRVAYFRQARNGLYVRMALLEYLLK